MCVCSLDYEIHTLNIVILIFHITESSPDAETTHQTPLDFTRSSVSSVHQSDVKLSKNSHTPWGDKSLERRTMRKVCISLHSFSNIYLLWTTIAFFL